MLERLHRRSSQSGPRSLHRPPPNATQQAMASCQAAAAMAPSVSAGMTSKLNTAFAKNVSHTKTKSGSKTVCARGSAWLIGSLVGSHQKDELCTLLQRQPRKPRTTIRKHALRAALAAHVWPMLHGIIACRGCMGSHMMDACAAQKTKGARCILALLAWTGPNMVACAAQKTKDGATYNIDYSMTIYGYNAITVGHSGTRLSSVLQRICLLQTGLMSAAGGRHHAPYAPPHDVRRRLCP